MSGVSAGVSSASGDAVDQTNESAAFAPQVERFTPFREAEQSEDTQPTLHHNRVLGGVVARGLHDQRDLLDHERRWRAAPRLAQPRRRSSFATTPEATTALVGEHRL